MADIELLQSRLQTLQIDTNDNMLHQYVTYYEMIVEKNKVMNLTAITEFPDFVEKHFMDSLSLVKATDLTKIHYVMDVGTGAGFPAIPLKIAFPHLHITMLDSLQKRVGFLDEVIAELGLSNTNAVHGRAEDLGHNPKYREKYDLCVSRAVANLSTLSEYCIPFVKKGGLFISYKSGGSIDEIQGANKAIKVMGGKMEPLCQFTLPGTDISRILVPVKKTEPTPKKYPRKAGLPNKCPIQ